MLGSVEGHAMFGVVPKLLNFTETHAECRYLLITSVKIEMKSDVGMTLCLQ